jgi:hypothetical protein
MSPGPRREGLQVYVLCESCEKEGGWLNAKGKWDASLFPASTLASIEPPEIGKRPNFPFARQ